MTMAVLCRVFSGIGVCVVGGHGGSMGNEVLTFLTFTCKDKPSQ